MTRPNVTIITDASFDDRDGVGGYGYCIASSRGKRYGGGSFLDLSSDCNEAEMKALALGLYEGITTELVCFGDTVLLQTDSTTAIGRFSKQAAPYSAYQVKLLEWFDSVVVAHALDVRFRHVKGHTDREESRYRANALCDKRARQGMLEARKARAAHLATINCRRILEDV